MSAGRQQVAASHTDELTLREARARYFRENGFGEDGGYAKRWVEVQLGPIPFAFPNTQARVRAVLTHDLHHVVTGYATDLVGEAEIAAWVAAALGLWGTSLALLLAPLVFAVAAIG